MSERIIQLNESAIKEALIEMYLVGVSVRRVEDIAEALWGTKVRQDPRRVRRVQGREVQPEISCGA